jgi:hypothetical protein
VAFAVLARLIASCGPLHARHLVEHSLAHIAARKGSHARYIGVRKNQFDLSRTSSIQNLEALHRVYLEAA